MKMIQKSSDGISGKKQTETDTENVKQPPSTPWASSSLALSMLLSSLGISIPNVALPALAQIFTVSFGEIQWVILAYLLASTITIVGVGRLGDILGHRRVFLAGIILFTMSSILCGIASTFWILIAGRVAQGIGAAILLTLTIALVRQTVPKEKTGQAMGLLGTMSALGTALGPSIGGLLLTRSEWRVIFLIMVPIGILNFFLAHRYLPVAHLSQIKKHTRQFDHLGTLLLALTLTTYALAVTVGEGHFDWLNIILLLIAILGGILFIFVEARIETPLIDLAIFHNPMLSVSLAMNMIVSTVMMTTLVIGPFYLSLALGLNEALVGIIMSVGPIISILTGIPAGHIVDRFGAPFVVTLGLIEMVTGTFMLTVLPEMLGVTGYILAIVILTPGYQLFQAANNTDIMMEVHLEQRGIISGILNLSRNLGLITGASIMGAIFAAASMSVELSDAHPVAISNGMQFTFTVAGLMIFIALGINIASKGSEIRIQSK